MSSLPRPKEQPCTRFASPSSLCLEKDPFQVRWEMLNLGVRGGVRETQENVERLIIAKMDPSTVFRSS